jgi:succinate dehydrogenase / fumarate reductase, cytochrome b subunit
MTGTGTGILSLYRSTIGKKVVMALTGLILTAYVFVHMIGNLKVFAGAEKLDHYAEWLRLDMGYPLLASYQGLWFVRIILLAAVSLHVISALQLWAAANAGRSVGYRQKKKSYAVYLGQMMRLGGIAIGFFIVYHLLHLTTGTIHPEFVYGAVYHNVISGFQNTLVSAFYIAALVALGVHILHGIWSMFQTLGLNNRLYDAAWRTVALLVTLAILVGDISIPVAVLAGWLD